MTNLRAEIAAFCKARDVQASDAKQIAALQIACHMDLAEALGADPDARARIILRLERAVERERLRGARRHWSYDLNRHIALKQVLDRVRALEAGEPGRSGEEQTGSAGKACRKQTAPEGAAKD